MLMILFMVLVFVNVSIYSIYRERRERALVSKLVQERAHARAARTSILSHMSVPGNSPADREL
jgi:hypothetical protein